MKNSKNKYIFSIIAVLILWCSFFFIFNKYYQDIIGLVTEGAKNEIQLLELFYYRGETTVYILIGYFLILMLTMLISQVMKIQSMFNKKFEIYYYIVIAILILVMGISLISLLRLVFIVLFILSFTLTFIIYTISKTKYTYDSGDIIYEKSGFLNENEANIKMNQFISERNHFYEVRNYKLFGEIIVEIEGTYKIELCVEKKD